MINKAIKYYKENGFIRTAKKVLIKLFDYREVIMFHKQITQAEVNYINNLNIKVASSKDIDENYQDYWYTKEQALEKLKDGHILFLAKDNTINTLYVWVDLKKIDMPWLNIKNLSIPPKVAYLATTYVPPRYQGRFILKRALKFISKYLFDNSIADTLLSITEPDTASYGIIKICGYIPYQKVKYFKIKVINLYVYIVKSLENGGSQSNKMFIRDYRFWNFYSSILKRSA